MNDFEAGDKIVFCRSKKNKQLNDVTIGKIYTMIGEYKYDLSFKDDVGKNNYSASFYGNGKATKIIK